MKVKGAINKEVLGGDFLAWLHIGITEMLL